MIPTESAPLFRQYTLAELEEIIRQSHVSHARYVPVGVPVRERRKKREGRRLS